MEFLRIAEVHYTTIQKAIGRLPSGLLATAMTIIAERLMAKEGRHILISKVGRKLERQVEATA